jgi:hypothetical protein
MANFAASSDYPDRPVQSMPSFRIHCVKPEFESNTLRSLFHDRLQKPVAP